MIKLGTSDMAKAYIGSTEVSKMYLGSELVYENAPAPLPYDAEVEYLQTDGSAYIDTEIAATSSISFIFDIFMPTWSGSDTGCWVFGARVSNSSKQICLSIYPGRANNQANWGYSGKQNTFYKNFKNDRFLFSNTTSRHKLEVDGTVVSTSTSTTTFTSNNNIYILTLNNNGSASSSIYSGSRLFSAKIYSGSDMVRDMIPVRVGQVGYMYDKVSDTLFGNAAATGAFVLGSDVNS